MLVYKQRWPGFAFISVETEDDIKVILKSDIKAQAVAKDCIVWSVKQPWNI